MSRLCDFSDHEDNDRKVYEDSDDDDEDDNANTDKQKNKSDDEHDGSDSDSSDEDEEEGDEEESRPAWMPREPRKASIRLVRLSLAIPRDSG